jgi:hypothetical protein
MSASPECGLEAGPERVQTVEIGHSPVIKLPVGEDMAHRYAGRARLAVADMAETGAGPGDECPFVP